MRNNMWLNQSILSPNSRVMRTTQTRTTNSNSHLCCSPAKVSTWAKCNHQVIPLVCRLHTFEALSVLISKAKLVGTGSLMGLFCRRKLIKIEVITQVTQIMTCWCSHKTPFISTMWTHRLANQVYWSKMDHSRTLSCNIGAKIR